MNRRHALKILAGASLCPLCAQKGIAAEGAHWSYEGDAGPAKWGDLDAASKVCAIGSQQSPIDIETTIKSQLPALKIDWASSADTIVNNGHTIQLNLAQGSTMTLGDVRYQLLQIHFHRPSEHLIRGKNFPMEAHCVHRAETGGLAVVGVLMKTGKPNAAFSRIVSTMPAKEGPAVKADARINPNALLPAKRGYYRYSGSLTTPPCAETVEWLLLTDPIQVAEADVASFAKLYPMNARPVQKDNRRYVLQQSPVHSAHVGQEMEVHYRWHPYFGCTVRIRRVEQRATGLFLKVQGPAGVVISMAAWMLDPVTCAGMTMGAPQVDRAALMELDQLLIDKGRNRRSPIDAAIVQEECHEDRQGPGRDTGFPTIDPIVRRKMPGGIELTGTEQGEATAGTNPDASCRPQRRGA